MLTFQPRARKHLFCLSYFEDFGGGNTKESIFLRFALKRYVLCFKRVVRLDGCVAFSRIEPRTQNLEWELVVVASFPNGIRKSRGCHFSHYEMDGLEGSESALSRKFNIVLPFKA